MSEDVFAMARRVASEKEGPISKEIFKGTHPMTEEELVEKVAERIWNEDSIRVMNAPRSVPWAEAGGGLQETARWQARAAIAAMREAGFERMEKLVENLSYGYE